MSDVANEGRDTIKEPDEPEHESECHILNASGDNNDSGPQPQSDNRNRTDDSLSQDSEVKEKGQLDEEPESNKDEKDGWLYVLGHELLKKRTIKTGGGIESRPVNSQLVTFRYKGCIHEEENEIDNNDRTEIILGDGDTLMAFDLCLALMEIGEICEVITDGKYAYGAKGREPDIPPNASMHYELELLDVGDPPDPAKMTANERVASADKKRERGNNLFAQVEYTSAIMSYTKALKILDIRYDVNIKEESDKKILEAARVKCYNNLAAAQLKVDAWDAAIKSSDDALRIQPNNVKALFRKGKCLAGKGELSSAINTLRQALNLEPETKIIHQELSRLVNKQKAEEDKTRDMYKRMMGTDKEREEVVQTRKSWRWWAVGGATAAAIISVGFGMFTHRQLHM